MVLASRSSHQRINILKRAEMIPYCTRLLFPNDSPPAAVFHRLPHASSGFHHGMLHSETDYNQQIHCDMPPVPWHIAQC